MDLEAQLEAARQQALDMGLDPEDDFILSDLIEGEQFLDSLLS